MKFLPFLICLLTATVADAQFNIPEPVVNSGSYAISDTIYMSPDGNDANPGSFDQPVKSFSVAVQKLPFGTAGINNGNAYGLIRLKPGFYKTATGFQQYTNQWKSGNTYKNISIEGIGEVIIGGTKDTFATGHLLQLSGDHIFIKNIHLRYSTGIGLLLNRADVTTPRQRNVLIDGVKVDSVGNFSMLLRNVDTILVTNSRSYYSSRPGADQLTSPCQWPSGIKFFNSKNIIIKDSEIAYSRGEGLNFHNSQLGKAFNNKIHDNSLNFYNDNSIKLQVHNNIIYNTPGISTEYWRACPSDVNPVWAGGGMLIANEGACDNGNSPVFENCQTKCFLPNEYFPNVDSMFVYNNIFQNTGEAIGFWQGTTSIVGVNCIKNVFIFNNTFIGSMAMPGAPANGFVKAFFSDYNILLNSFYGFLQNVKITDNIFSFDTIKHSNLDAVKITFHPNHPGPKDITFNNNIWVKNHPYVGPQGEIRGNLPFEVNDLTDSVSAITPCPDNPEFIKSATAAFSFLTTDFNNNPRTASTNVGAIEYTMNCNTTGVAISKKVPFKVIPNPCNNCTSLKIEGIETGKIFRYKLFSASGQIISSGTTSDGTINLMSVSAGFYFLSIQNKDQWLMEKIIIN